MNDGSPKRIYCAGAPRSGSTWQYNAVRLMAKALNVTVHGAWIADYDPSDPSSVHVIKVHDASDMKPDDFGCVVTIYRDLGAVASSMMRMGWLPNAGRQEIFDFLDGYLRTCAAWSARAAYVGRYEDMMASPERELRRLAAAVGFSLDDGQFEEVARRLRDVQPPEDTPGGDKRYDRETLLHPGHVGPAGESLLTEEDLAAIRERYRDWLSARGYS